MAFGAARHAARHIDHSPTTALDGGSYCSNVPTSSILNVTAWASLAAIAAVLGPFLITSRESSAAARSLGLASALAAGAMLGVCFPLMSVGLARAGVSATLGAVLGIAASYATHVLLGVGADDPAMYPKRAVTAGALHSAPEGVAIGAAMAVGPRFGLFLVATLAVHNIWESQVLGSQLLAGGETRTRAAAFGVLTNIPQVLFAGAVYVVAIAAPMSVPLFLGIGFGALTYLCFAELLPESYKTTGRTSIAMVVSVAAGVVALLGGSTR